MGAVATFLIQKNRQLLLGASIPPAGHSSIMQVLIKPVHIFDIIIIIMMLIYIIYIV